jgi:hypothetical protein
MTDSFDDDETLAQFSAEVLQKKNETVTGRMRKKEEADIVY